MIIWENIFFAFWFFLPAGIANIFASLSGSIPKLSEFSYPMDFFATWRGKRVLGEHKTIRGLLLGIVGAIATVYLQKFFVVYWNLDLPIDYNSINPVLLGFLLGAGALLGDALKSFLKRQMNIHPGDSFLFFDQIDYIVGGILLSSLYVRLGLQQYLIIAILYFIFHFIVNILGYLIGIRPKAF